MATTRAVVAKTRSIARVASSIILTAIFLALQPGSGLCDGVSTSAVEPEHASTSAEAPTLPYFSAIGQAYARKHRLPRPPFFRHGRTEDVDPPRDVAAADWNGVFCREWTDECTICKRNGDRHSCAPVASGDAACTRRAVTCTTTGIGPDELLERFCRRFDVHRIERLRGVDHDVQADQGGVTWYLARRDRRWHFWVAEDAYLPQAPRTGEPRPPRPEHVAQDWRCIEAIGSPRRLSDLDGDPVIER